MQLKRRKNSFRLCSMIKIFYLYLKFVSLLRWLMELKAKFVWHPHQIYHRPLLHNLQQQQIIFLLVAKINRTVLYCHLHQRIKTLQDVHLHRWQKQIHLLVLVQIVHTHQDVHKLQLLYQGHNIAMGQWILHLVDQVQIMQTSYLKVNLFNY